MANEQRGRIVIDAEAKGFGQLKSEIGSIEGTLARFGSSAGLAAIGLGAITTVTAHVVSGIADLYLELGKFDRLSKKFVGDVGAVEEALRFGVSEIDIMHAQLRLHNAGVHITGEGYKDLADSALKLSKVMGEDVAETFKGLEDLLVTGSARKAKYYGLTIDAEKAEKKYAEALGGTVAQLTDIGKLQARQEAYLEAIAKKTKDMSEPVVTATDRWNKLKDTVADATRDMLRNIKTTVGDTVYYLGEMADEASLLWRRISGGRPSDELTGHDRQAKAALGAIERAQAAQAAAMDPERPYREAAARRLAAMPKPAGSPFDLDPKTLKDAFGWFDVSMSDVFKKGKGAKGARREVDQRAIDAGYEASLAVEQATMGGLGGIKPGALMGGTREGAEIYQARQKEEDDRQRKGQIIDLTERIRLLKEESDITAKLKELNKAQEKERFARGMAQANDPIKFLIESHYNLAKGVQLSGAALDEFNRKLEAQTASGLVDLTISGLAGLAGGMWAAADAAIQGGDSFGMGMAKMLKATFLGIASQATVKAAFEVAEGVACLASIFRAAEAPGHFTAAGMYAGVAVMAGGAGLAISAATAPSGQASASSRRSSESSSSSRTQRSFGQKSEDNRPVYVQLYLTPGDPAALALAGRKLDAQIRKAAA